MSCWTSPRPTVASSATLAPALNFPPHQRSCWPQRAKQLPTHTYFDKRDINHNFDYDYEAYAEVKRNLGRLIDSGHLQPAMQLALELMDAASHQVEMSDEGMMTEDIEDCLHPVIKALEKSDLPPSEIVAWCSAMLAKDRVGFIADEELESLRTRFQVAATQ
jgi:hypothetical protein